MLKSIRTNKICAEFSLQNIQRDFDIYKITTTEKYIPGGAYLLDKPLIKAKSIVYEYGKSFYILYTKNTMMVNDLKKSLQPEEKGDTLSFECIRVEKIPKHLLVQLFLNSINNPNNELLSFNNLTGKLICYRNDWINTDKKNFIWGLDCLELKIGNDMCLHLLAHRLSAYALKNKMEFKKRRIHEYPQYNFTDHNHTLKRADKKELNRSENFIMKPVEGERGGITYLNFQDQEKFEYTKIGVLYNILSILKNEYNEYLKVDFEKSVVSKCLEYKKSDLNKFKDVVNKLVLSNGIMLLDGVKDETSELYLRKLRERLEAVFPAVEVSVGKHVSKQKLNIKLIHHKAYYEKMTHDPHNDIHEGAAVQHITLENFKLAADAAVENVLKELVIKKDLINRKISLVDWRSYEYQSDWIFGIQDGGKYYFMTVHPDGTFEIKRMKRNLFNISDYDKYMDYLGNNADTKKHDYRQAIGLVRDVAGNINIISDTNQITMPEVSTLGDSLVLAAKDVKFPGNYIINVIERLIQSGDAHDKYLDILTEAKDRFVADEEYDKTYITSIVKNKSARKVLTDFVYEDTGELLYLYLRNQEKRNVLFSGLLDINYSQIDSREAIFNVGIVGAGMQTFMERASVIRKVEAVDDGELFFEELLPLMGVEFVRYGMLTVMPFPFKYLREFSLLEGSLIESQALKKELFSSI
ncbi:hypothetical protein [Paenibacillus aestuarii]|uniref:ATP-grasp domain-containing protein n=1 Tax=Paenibacillus aestuarii TaxID=516965 RepID=A0ABW0KFZ0_9BACL|nr:hypothetical protein [Paenibacillus aestuarii]